MGWSHQHCQVGSLHRLYRQQMGHLHLQMWKTVELMRSFVDEDADHYKVAGRGITHKVIYPSNMETKTKNNGGKMVVSWLSCWDSEDILEDHMDSKLITTSRRIHQWNNGNWIGWTFPPNARLDGVPVSKNGHVTVPDSVLQISWGNWVVWMD